MPVSTADKNVDKYEGDYQRIGEADTLVYRNCKSLYLASIVVVAEIPNI